MLTPITLLGKNKKTNSPCRIWPCCDRRNEHKIKETPQYSQALAIFQNDNRFSADLGQDSPRDVITTRIKPKPSSFHVRRT